MAASLSFPSERAAVGWLSGARAAARAAARGARVLYREYDAPSFSAPASPRPFFAPRPSPPPPRVKCSRRAPRSGRAVCTRRAARRARAAAVVDVAVLTALATLAAAPALRILKGPVDAAPFGDDDRARLRRGLGATLALCGFCVSVAFAYSRARSARRRRSPSSRSRRAAPAAAPAAHDARGHGAGARPRRRRRRRRGRRGQRAALNGDGAADASAVPPRASQFRSGLHVTTGVPLARPRAASTSGCSSTCSARPGAGIATNQNLSMILESEGARGARARSAPGVARAVGDDAEDASPSVSLSPPRPLERRAAVRGARRALFALASTCRARRSGCSSRTRRERGRPEVGVAVARRAVRDARRALVAAEGVAPTMGGVLLCGLAFGAFFTLVVPVVNECWRARLRHDHGRAARV